MIYVYVLLVFIFLLSIAYGRMQKYKADSYQAQRSALMDKANAQGRVIAQKNKTEADVSALQADQQADQRVEQAKLDAGDRSGMDTDSF